EPSALILLVHEQNGSVIPERDFQHRFPRTYGYLKRFEQVLRQRRDAMVQGMYRRGLPFYAYSAVGDYTFAPWKVVWREQASELTTAVVGPRDAKPVIPDHKLMIVDCQSQDEAYYMCGLLNSALGRFIVHSYAVAIQMDPHILDHIRIPRFDPGNPVHRRLAELSKGAHEATNKANDAQLRQIEEGIDEEAAKLWGLSEAELREIQASLRELEGEAATEVD
ncbi:MAG: hypothetical protein C4337_08215, partial [Armatimonadota bacterium]